MAEVGIGNLRNGRRLVYPFIYDRFGNCGKSIMVESECHQKALEVFALPALAHRRRPELVDSAARTGAADGASAAAAARGPRGPRAVGCVFEHLKNALLTLFKPSHDN